MIETNWIVFTGPASSGKSTLIACLEKLGHMVKNEVVRDYLFELYGENIPVQDIPWSSLTFQSELLKRKQQRETTLSAMDLIFFDRGVPDTYAYSSLHGIPFSKLHVEHPYRYKAVFLFERLPVVQDNLRRDTEEEVCAQEQAIRRTYESFGYDLIPVPNFLEQGEKSIDMRLSFIQDKVSFLFSS